MGSVAKRCSSAFKGAQTRRRILSLGAFLGPMAAGVVNALGRSMPAMAKGNGNGPQRSISDIRQMVVAMIRGTPDISQGWVTRDTKEDMVA